MTDFQFFDHGSIVVLKAVTPSAQDWVDEHIATDDDTQYFGGGIVIEPRYAGDILDGIAADDLAVTFH